MVMTIQQVLRPLLIMSFIMGLSVYPMKQSNPRIRWIAYLSILYCLTIWFFYAYFIYHLHIISLSMWKVLHGSVINKTVFTITTFTAITSAIMNFCHQKKFEISLNKLSAVDDCLEELGVSKTYQKIHTCSKLIVIGWIVYCLAKNFCDIIWAVNLQEINSWELFLPHIINYNTHVNAFVDLQFIILLWFIGTRFDKVNEHIRCLLVREDHGLRCTWKRSVVAFHRFTLCTDYKQTLWTSMHLHLELCRIARELNFIFGIQITIQMAVYFIYITSLSYGLCLLLMRKMPKEALESPIIWFAASSWCLILLIRVYVVNYICESVKIKANEINKIIHQLTNTFRYADVWKEIYQFTLQVVHHPLKLTGINFFYLGNEFFRKFCITIVTYVIIMVQMEVSYPQFTVKEESKKQTSHRA